MFGRLLRGTDIYLRNNSIFVFQLLVTLWNQTFDSSACAALVAAWATSRLLRQMLARDDEIATLYAVIRFLRRYQTCSFTAIDLPKLVGDPVWSRHFKNAVPLRGGMLVLENALRNLVGRPSMADALKVETRAYVVRRGTSEHRPGPTAFTTSLGGFIFVTEPPENFTGVQRWYVLHELGHLSPYAKYTRHRARQTVANFVLLLIWAMPQVGLAYLWILLLLALHVTRDTIGYALDLAGRTFDEMRADLFALRQLSDVDRLAVARSFLRWGVPDDPRLFAGNTFRREALIANLQLVQKNDGRLDEYYAYDQPTRTLSHELVFGLVAFVGAWFIGPVTTASCLILGFFWLTTFQFFLFQLARASALRTWIAEALARSPAVPAKTVKVWPAEPAGSRKLREWLGIEPIADPAMTQAR